MNDMTSIAVGGPLSLPALIQWALLLFKQPRAFFRAMERKGGYFTPCMYLLAWSGLSSVVGFFVGLLRPVPAGLLGGRATQVAAIFLGPLAALVGGFIAAGILFVIWHLMGSKEDFQTSFRCWAFMAPVGVITALLGIVPFLPVVGIVYMLFLLVVASQEVHGISEGRAWTVWGLLGGAFLMFVLFAVMLGIVAGGKGAAGRSFPSPTSGVN